MWKTISDIDHVALIIIDLQELDISPNHGALVQESPAVVSHYLSQIYERVLPNTHKVLSKFRDLGGEIIHVRIQSLTKDGRDRSIAHKKLGLHVPPHSSLANFLPGVEPLGDEIILNKTTSDAFHSTILEQLLRNMGVKELVMCGVFTHECVSSTVRSACDLNFEVTVIGDACAATTDLLHTQALMELDQRYARVISTQNLVEELKNNR